MKRLLIALFVTVAFVSTAFAKDPIVLKATHSANINEPYHIGFQYFADKVKEKTNGEIVVEIFPNSVLGNEIEMVEGVLLGNVDVAVVSNGVLTNFVPELKLFDLPYLFDSREHLYEVVDGEVGKELQKHIEKKGFALLAFYEVGIRHAMTTKKAINSIDDLKNMKIRTMEVPAHVESFNQFGAKATPLAYGELYSALQAGVVDGAEAANSNYYSKQFYKVAPYWAQIGWTMLVGDVFMSAERLNSLSKEHQKAIMEAALESAAVERKAYADTDKALLDQLKKEGVTVTYPDPAPFRQASKKVYDKYVTDDNTKKLLDLIEKSRK